jgi:hypothetical protein
MYPERDRRATVVGRRRLATEAPKQREAELRTTGIGTRLRPGFKGAGPTVTENNKRRVPRRVNIPASKEFYESLVVRLMKRDRRVLYFLALADRS